MIVATDQEGAHKAFANYDSSADALYSLGFTPIARQLWTKVRSTAAASPHVSLPTNTRFYDLLLMGLLLALLHY